MTRVHDAASDMMRNMGRWLIGAAGGFILSSCGSVMMADQPQGPPPDSKSVVLRYLRTKLPPVEPGSAGSGPGKLFADVQKLGAVELSPPTSIRHPTVGWTWLTCFRTHPADGSTNDFALFIDANSIRDARLSVATDGCAARTYEALGRFDEPAKKTDNAPRRRTRGER
jgi:hypothetical protein